MYYRLNEKELEHLKRIQKVIPNKDYLFGDFIEISNILEMLYDLYNEYMKFVEYCEDAKSNNF